MKTIFYAILTIFLPLYANAQQVDYDNSVRFYAEDVDTGLLLKWTEEAGVNNYIISKRFLGQTTYQLVANVPSSENSYLDTDITEKLLYEYKITKSKTSGSTLGFLSGGKKVTQIYSSGYILLLIKSNISEALTAEIERYENDLHMENWTTFKEVVSDTHSVDQVKAIIKNYYQEYTSLKTVVLIGNIPVPYSGLINPDGHPDHLGAWPCDAYYADMDGLWTDTNINNDLATGFRNDNVPEDGKFDQSNIGKVELEIGRIDFSNLPAFPQSEIELTRNYFNKNHDFRTCKTKFRHRGLIQNNFPSFAEAFGQSGVNNFSRMFGPDSVFYLPYKSTLQTEDYLWSYGCGPGNYTGAGGIGNTFELVNENHKTVFTMLFGSYFGDWDNENNYLRATLATGNTLTNVWAGRPHWYFQHMAMGFNIGYSTKLTQNNNSEFPTGFGGKSVHIALMGDPSLTMYPVETIDSISYTIDKNSVNLAWHVNDTTDIVAFDLYYKSKNDNYLTEIGGYPKSTYSTIIPCLTKGEFDFVVKARKIFRSASGSFIKQSIAKTIKVTISEEANVTADFDANVYYDLITATPHIENANFGKWRINSSYENNSDSLLSYLTKEPGVQQVCLHANGECGEIIQCKDLLTTSSLPDYEIIKTEALCHDDTISNEIHIIQENAPFNVVWDDGTTGLIHNNITTSSIGFTITTSTGRTTKVFTLNDFPDKIIISGNVTSEIENESKGNIQLNVTGGTPPFIYIMNGDTLSNGEFTDLYAGEYTIEVNDAYQCKESKTFIIQFITGIDEEQLNQSSIRLMQDESNIYLKDLASAANISSVSLFNISGQKIGNFSKINSKEEWQFKHNNLTVGLYLVKIDAAGKKVIKKWIK